MTLICLPIKVSTRGDWIMTTAVAPAYGSLMANPLLEGKVIKEGIYSFYPFMLEEIQVGRGTLVKSPSMERLFTSPVVYFEFVTQGDTTFGVVVTENSVYKVRVLS